MPGSLLESAVREESFQDDLRGGDAVRKDLGKGLERLSLRNLSSDARNAPFVC